jgi:nitroimidazol reductase NimA-like FMN-containing flavoprotein (pyridoxamine 5'-phosphate oxidase superfamily)
MTARLRAVERTNAFKCYYSESFRYMTTIETDMSERQFGAWLGTPMADDDIDALLSSAGYGILSLARGDEAYAIPVSIGYDRADRIFLVLLETAPPQQKFEFVEATERGCLTVTDIASRFNWKSVIVQGPLEEIETDGEAFEELLAAMDDNAWFSRTFVRDSGLHSVRGFVLEAESVSGLQKRGE